MNKLKKIVSTRRFWAIVSGVGTAIGMAVVDKNYPGAIQAIVSVVLN